MSLHGKKWWIQTILITGGTGFIWSHLAIELLALWYEVIIVDNLSNSDRSILDKITTLSPKSPLFYEGDIRDKSTLENIFHDYTIGLVIHLAWLKSITESVKNISLYHNNNIVGSITLFETMEKYACRSIIFSSTATVYDENNIYPLCENSSVKPINPYSNSKLIIESILRDFSSHAWWKVISLRYFNPIGAHSSWLIWEDINWMPCNLLPVIMKRVTEWDPVITIFGNDYDTIDWTCIRDYIHIIDLVSAHIDVINYLEELNEGVFEIFNIGTGVWVSVMEIVNAISNIIWKDIEYKVGWRRAGDMPITYCNPRKANSLLWWRAKYTYKDAIRDYWNFIKMNKF
jgi:UDP-glucose 4-epimerase